MLTEKLEESAVLNFLDRIEEGVKSLEDLKAAVEQEKESARIDALVKSSGKPGILNYVKSLNAIQEILTSQASIKIVFANNQQLVYAPHVQKRTIEDRLLRLIVKFVREGSL